MYSKRIYWLSISLYVTSLILPFEGRWLGGLLLMLSSSVMSLAVIYHSLSNPEVIGQGFGYLIVGVPFFNFVYILSVCKFKKNVELVTPTTATLFISTVVAIGFLVLLLINQAWQLYLYFIWCFALVLLNTAIYLKWKHA